jgi:F-type H+-transporting ATPase subunit epsilon
MNHYTVDVLTPSNVVVKDMPAESLLVPTVRGQINILAEHTHMVTKLDTGVLTSFGAADDPDRHFVLTTGLCKVLDGKVVILAKTAEETTNIDTDRAEAALKVAQDHLAHPENLTDYEYEKYFRKAERAKIRIQMSQYSLKK